MTSPLYAIEVETLAGTPLKMEAYRGKVLLIVNTASRCGFTPQYASLQFLQNRFRERGFAVLGFPCNQFARQEPGTPEEISRFCQREYEITFPMHAKIDVNGDSEHALYTYLKREKGGLLGRRIKWNFTKFLVDVNGEVVARYGSIQNPTHIARDIAALLPLPDVSPRAGRPACASR